MYLVREFAIWMATCHVLAVSRNRIDFHRGCMKLRELMAVTNAR